MTKPETIKTLEKRYHVHIDREFYYPPFPWGDETWESFYVYSKDGCCWDKIIGYRSLVRTLARDKDALKRIADGEAI